jgi:ribosomal protein S4
VPNRTQPKVKRSRALGLPLTPKSGRYFERRPYPPGEHGRARRTMSDYAARLRQKQRLRHQYGISETQLRRAFDRARRSAGKTGEVLIADLETRLEAVVFRAGFARTIYQARQFVTHGHIALNGRRWTGRRTLCGRVTWSACGTAAANFRPSSPPLHRNGFPLPRGDPVRAHGPAEPAPRP